MTQGETLFYLREIHARWCTSNVSTQKLAELAAARLIEINGGSAQEVRLTSEGVRQKNLGRRPGTSEGISLTRRAKPFRQWVSKPTRRRAKGFA